MLAMVSILIGFSTLLLMLWKLHSVRNVLVKDTRRLHIAFMIVRAPKCLFPIDFSAIDIGPDCNCYFLLYHGIRIPDPFSTDGRSDCNVHLPDICAV